MSDNKYNDEMVDFLHDASNFKGECDEIYIPEDIPEFQKKVVELLKNGTKITTSGSRTGLTGGCVPQGGALVVTRNLNKITGFDEETSVVTCEPGVLLSDLQKYLHDFGFFFPADPTEELCTIGGVVANNSSGATSFKYGAARNFVTAIQLLLPEGDYYKVERGVVTEKFGYFSFKPGKDKSYNLPVPKLKMPKTKNAAGYFAHQGSDLIDLFIGSEGTLGIFLRIKLKVVPLPQRLFSCVAFFKNVEDALSFIKEQRTAFREHKSSIENTVIGSTTQEDIMSEHENGVQKTDAPIAGLRALEFFDGKALEFLRGDYPRIPGGMGAAVWFEVETTTEQLDETMVYWADKISNHNASIEDVWYAFDTGDLQEIKKFRHAISYKVNEYIASRGLTKLGTDTAVPAEFFNEYYLSAVKMVENAGLEYVTYGHFGDCHLHLNMLPKDQNEYLKGKQIYLDLCKVAVEHGGTVSAEHGIGKLKKEYLKLMYGEAGINEMKKVKKYLDPQNLLNVGNMFD